MNSEFTDCTFDGPPPDGFTSWNAWTAEPVKRGVTIRATSTMTQAQCSKAVADFFMVGPATIEEFEEFVRRIPQAGG